MNHISKKPNDVFFAQMTIDFEIDIEQSENQNCQIQLSLEGAFISSSDVDKDTFRQLVIVNGAAAIIGIAMGKNRNDYFKCFQQWKNCYPIYQCDRLL